MAHYTVTFYRAPDTGERRVHKVTSVSRACQNAAEALAYAAVCLSKSRPDMVASIVRVTVEEAETPAVRLVS